jgi:hypothetical protein
MSPFYVEGPPNTVRLPCPVGRPLKVTPGMLNTQEVRKSAGKTIAKTRGEIVETSQAMGEGDPTFFLACGTFAKALKLKSWACFQRGHASPR